MTRQLADMRPPRTLWLGIPVAFLWLGVDQITKWWALQHFTRASREIALGEYFSLVLVHNTGVTFGMFSSVPRWVLVPFMLVVALALVVWMSRAANRSTVGALGIIAGGALGNIADRVRHGAVTDFLDFHVGQWHWPAFNVADIGIVCGVAVLLLKGHVRTRGRRNGAPPERPVSVAIQNGKGDTA